MASSEKTELGLNQWLSTDKPERTDFVNDNVVIDSLLSQHAESIKELKNGGAGASALSIEVYTGNGTSVKTVNLSFTPKFVLVYGINKNNFIFDSSNSVSKIYSGYASAEGTSGGISIMENAVQFTNNRNPVGGVQMLFNESGTQYVMVLFR